MKEWDEIKNEVWKTKSDKQLANSILKMVDVRLNVIKYLNKKEFTPIIIENYYEIIKELITALMSVDGYKTLSHEALIAYLKQFHKIYTRNELFLIDQLRQTRNKIVYEGFFVREDYLSRNENQLNQLIEKLKKTLIKKLSD